MSAGAASERLYPGNGDGGGAGLISSFIHYVALNVMGMLGLSCYILADTFFIANGVGSAGLTALNLVLPVYSLINGTGLMLGMGGATVYSILRGEGDETKGLAVFSQTLTLAALAGILFTAAGAFFAAPLAALLGAEQAILPLATDYLRIIMLFSCAFILNNVFLCFVRNDGEPGRSMRAMLTGSLCNIAMDYVLIYPMGLGMFGAALATGIAPLISLSILSYHWRGGKCSLKVAAAVPVLRNIKRVASLGFPSFLTELSSGVIMLLFNFTILNLAGNVGVAAYGIIANIALIVASVFTGVAQGIQPLVSYNFGLKRADLTNRLLGLGLCVSLVLGALFWLSGALFPDVLISFFNKDGGDALAGTAKMGILFYFPAFLFTGMNIVSASWLSSVSRPKPAFLLSILRGGAAVIPAALLLPRLFGLPGVWLSIPLAEVITFSAAVIIRLRLARE